MRRFTRLTNGFSKKLENHAYAVALHQMFYNFARIHQSLRITPAMAAGVTDKVWDVSDVVAMIEKWEADLAANGVEYLIERVKIGSGFLVQKLARYAEPQTVFGFKTPGEAEMWVEEDRRKHRPGRRPKPQLAS